MVAVVVIADSFVNLKVVGVYGRVAIGNVVGVVSMVVLVARRPIRIQRMVVGLVVEVVFSVVIVTVVMVDENCLELADVTVVIVNVTTVIVNLTVVVSVVVIVNLTVVVSVV